jgi:hypothetical protein
LITLTSARAQAQAHAAIPILGYGLRKQALLLSGPNICTTKSR